MILKYVYLYDEQNKCVILPSHTILYFLYVSKFAVGFIFMVIDISSAGSTHQFLLQTFPMPSEDYKWIAAMWI